MGFAETLLLGVTISWILFGTGIIHVMRFCEIHREKRLKK